MKNIIKAFITHCQRYSDNYAMLGLNLESKFDELYEAFIEQYPIGEAELSIMEEIWNRARLGFKKYGVTSSREDYTLADWGQNMLEEILDRDVYKKVLLNHLQKHLENPLFLIKFVEFLKKEQ